MRRLQADAAEGADRARSRPRRRPAAAGRAARLAGRRRSRRRRAAVGGYRIGAPSLWRDEAATISGSHRPVAAILSLIRHQDAVHGLVLPADASRDRGRRHVGDRAPAAVADRHVPRRRPDRLARPAAGAGRGCAWPDRDRAAGRAAAGRGAADHQVRAGGQAVRADDAVRGARDATCCSAPPARPRGRGGPAMRRRWRWRACSTCSPCCWPRRTASACSPRAAVIAGPMPRVRVRRPGWRRGRSGGPRRGDGHQTGAGGPGAWHWLVAGVAAGRRGGAGRVPQRGSVGAAELGHHADGVHGGVAAARLRRNDAADPA